MAAVEIIASPCYSRITGPEEAMRIVRNLTTVEHPNARFIKAKQYGQWDGKIRFLRGNVMPTGLVHRVRTALRAEGFEVSAKLQTPLPALTPMPFVMPASKKLRDHQMLDPLKRFRQTVQIPTAGGKSIAGAYWVAQIGLRTLWICHRKDLLTQTIEVLSEVLICDVGKIGDGVMTVGHITVGMVPTLAGIKDKAFWEQWQVLVADEVHHVGSNSWYDVAMRCVNAGRRLGLSGTAKTGDPVADLRLEAAIGPLHIAATTQELTEKEYLAKATVNMILVDESSYPTYEEIRNDVLDWGNLSQHQKLVVTASMRRGVSAGKLYAEAYRRGIIDNPERMKALVESCKDCVEQGSRVLVLYTKLRHGRLIHEALAKAMPKVPIVLLSGEDSTDKRSGAKALAESESCILVASDIWREGVDIPDLDDLFMACGGKSIPATLQRAGRLLRVGRNRDKRIWDFMDGRKGKTKDYLRKHAESRIVAYGASGFPIKFVVPRIVMEA